MRKFFILFLIALTVFSLAGTVALAVEQDDADIYRELRAAVEELVGPGKAKGAVLSIVKDGELMVCTGFGDADAFLGFAADGDTTAFRIGSVSKTFVAVAAQRLVQDGMLDMDRTIADYLEEDFPVLSYPVTMRQLLTHTAGFEDRITGMAVSHVSDTEPLDKSVRRHMPKQVFRPGEVVSYSNYGIALAAYVVECVVQQDFSQFCREAIFLPLGMHRTTFEHMHDVVYVSKPYLPNGEETMEPYMNLYPEGSAVSTASDMAAYMAWLLDKTDGRVLSAQSKEALFSQQFSMADELPGVSLAFSRKERNGKLYYEKKGETLHFYSRIALYPEENAGVFLSFNTYLPAHVIDKVTQTATALLYGAPATGDAGPKKTTMDISGCYVNNWSNFTTPELLLRYLVPGKILTIDGMPLEGFSMNGEAMILIGEDLYQSPIGVLKFLNKNDTVMIATQSAITYSKIPFWQHSKLQVLPILLFAASVLVCLTRELFLLIGKQKRRGSRMFLICAIIQLLSFCTLCVLMYHGIASFSLLAFALPLKLCAKLFLAATAAGAGYGVYLKAMRNSLSPVSIIWALCSLLFCAWMIWVNLL